MITAEEYVKTFGRMCNSYGMTCVGCLVFSINGCDRDCRKALINCPAEVIAVVEKWGKEHPEPRRKTYAEDFFEKFPNAPKNSRGQPCFCRDRIYAEIDCGDRPCNECWTEEMPEKEENDGIRK